jgi:outer membrane autotransporter protein
MMLRTTLAKLCCLLTLLPAAPVAANPDDGAPAANSESEESIGLEIDDPGAIVTLGSAVTDSASANILSGDIDLTIEGDAEENLASSATAHSTGVQAADATAGVTNDTTIQATSTASATGGAVSLNLLDTASADARLVAIAEADGLVTGDGDDRVTNSIDRSVEAGAVAGSFSADIKLTLLDAPGTTIDTSTEACSEATAIDSGAGDDIVNNEGDVIATAFSEALNFTTTVEFIGETSSEARLDATARATGIDGGIGDDALTNRGLVDVDAIGIAGRHGKTVSISGAGGFDAFGLELVDADASQAANSLAIGMEGGDGDDTLANAGRIEVLANSDGLDSGYDSALVSFEIGTEPNLEASPISVAEAIGMSGGAGEDGLTNTSELDVEALGIHIGGELSTHAFGVGAAITAGRAEAIATGMDGGEDDDVLLNTSTIDSQATADTTLASIAAAVDIVPIIPTSFVSAKAEAASKATAIGMEGGGGNDVITNQGQVTANAEARMREILLSGTLGIDASGSGGGGGGGSAAAAASAASDAPSADDVDLAGQGLATATTSRLAEAVALSGGEGNDTIVNSAFLDVDAEASGVEVEVSGELSLDISSAVAPIELDGLEETPEVAPDAPAAEGDAATEDEGTSEAEIRAAAIDNRVEAVGSGIQGGAGNDSITNGAEIDVLALATSTDVGVRVKVSIPSNPLGLLALGGAVDATSASIARAAGIAGGSGNDLIINQHDFKARAETWATAVTTNLDFLSVVIPIPIEGILDPTATATTAASSSATGIRGDSGNDDIRNEKAITVEAETNSVGVSVGLALAGAAIGSADATVAATTTGISGGLGDDIVTNDGSVTSDADAHGGVTSVQVLLSLGGSVSSAGVESEADADGLAGDEGADELWNNGTVTSTADATLNVVEVTVQSPLTPGASVALSYGNVADAEATGMSGGLGDDFLRGTGTLTSTATSAANVALVSVSGTGASVGGAGVTSNATAVGARGGDGTDDIRNLGVVHSEARATAGAVLVDVNMTGAGVGSSETTLNANATGIGGDAGGDTLRITNNVTSKASSETTGTGVSVNLVGAAIQSAAVTVDAEATGASGGSENDDIENTALITADAHAKGKSGAVNVNLVGAAIGSASFDVDAVALGMRGDDGNDTVTNLGTLDVDGRSEYSFADVQVNIAGAGIASTGDADSHADSHVTGIAGGQGNDLLRNEGAVRSDANATLTAKANAAVSIAGFAGMTAEVAAAPDATGIDGGSDDDTIENLGTVDATAAATMTLENGSSFTLAGFATGDTDVTANATSRAITGGDGLDTISNDANVNAIATSNTMIGGGSTVIFGASNTDVTTNSTANSTAVDGGDGGGSVRNAGALSATSTATTSSTRSAYTFAGAATSGSVLDAASSAVGVRSGSGVDTITNEAEGLIQVRANSRLTSTGSAKATFGASSVSANVGSEISAWGIDTGAENDSIANSGTVDVSARLRTLSSSDSDAGLFFGEAGTQSTASGAAGVTGVATGTGNDQLDNSGTIHIDILPDANRYSVDARADSNGGDITFDGDAIATTNAAVTTSAVGIDTDAGEDVTTNTGQINVNNAPSVRALSIADGDGVDGDGDGTARVAAGNADLPILAVGIFTGADADIVNNEGSITATSAPSGLARVEVDGDNWGDVSGLVVATVRSQSIGVDTDEGADSVFNAGDIIARSRPNAVANNRVDAGWAGDASLTSDATAVADAIGIRTGIGADVVVNSGLVLADSLAAASGATHSTANAYATAIQTGDDADHVTNEGNGVIDTRIANVFGAGIGIDTGAGDDIVELRDQSTVRGTVMLGSEDDILSFAGEAGVEGVIDGMTGRDTLRITDDRTLSLLSADLLNVENHDLGRGHLALDGDYTILDGGGLGTEIHSDSHGRMEVFSDVTIGASTIANVATEVRLFADGEFFDLLSSDRIINDFSEVNLPEDSPFVRFRSRYLRGGVSEQFRVEVDVDPFAAHSRNRLDNNVARYVDRLVPGATGDLEQLLGNLQLNVAAADLDEALTSLSPDGYDASTLTAANTFRHYQRGIQNQMGLVRTSRSLGITPRALAKLTPHVLPTGTAMAALGLAGMLGAAASDDSEVARNRFWGSGFGQWSDQDGESGFSDFDYQMGGGTLGVDRSIGDHFLAGVSAGFAAASIDVSGNFGGGHINSAYGSLYGTWFDHGSYADVVLSYGHQWYENHRNIMVGGMQSRAESDHEGNAFGARIGGGHTFDAGGWGLRPYLNLAYIMLDERSFTEDGAGAANLSVEDRTTHALLSEIGLHVSRGWKTGPLNWVPFVSAAWKYDYDVDDRRIVSGFEDAGPSFSVAGRHLERNGALVTTGIHLIHEQMDFSLEYLGEFRSDYHSNGIYGRFGFAF